VCISSYIIVVEREIIKGVLKMERVVVEYELLRENELAMLTKTVVDEMEFPEFIVTTFGPFPTERTFRYDQYDLAEKYYNDLYFDRSHGITKW
jgi:hypothetical protein